MVDTLKLQLKDIENFNSSGDSFDVKLKNGAGCSFGKNNLKCSYNTQRFNEQIEIENIELKPSKKEISSETDKTFESKVTDDTKVTYDAKYPFHLGAEGSISLTTDGVYEPEKHFHRNSNMKIEGFSKFDKIKNENFIKFGENGKYALVNFEEDSFKIDNIKLEEKVMYVPGSRLEVESIDQIFNKIDLENKNATLEYDDTYQVRYYTEPDDNYHNLEINIV